MMISFFHLSQHLSWGINMPLIISIIALNASCQKLSVIVIKMINIMTV